MPPYEQALGDWGKEKLPFNRRKLDFKSPNRHLCLPRPHTLVSMDVALRSIPELQRQDHITESTSNFALALIGGTCHRHWEERNATQIRPRPISTYFWRSMLVTDHAGEPVEHRSHSSGRNGDQSSLQAAGGKSPSAAPATSQHLLPVKVDIDFARINKDGLTRISAVFNLSQLSDLIRDMT